MVLKGGGEGINSTTCSRKHGCSAFLSGHTQRGLECGSGSTDKARGVVRHGCTRSVDGKPHRMTYSLTSLPFVSQSWLDIPYNNIPSQAPWTLWIYTGRSEHTLGLPGTHKHRATIHRLACVWHVSGASHGKLCLSDDSQLTSKAVRSIDVNVI
jgi:hypothetical protein